MCRFTPYLKAFFNAHNHQSAKTLIIWTIKTLPSKFFLHVYLSIKVTFNHTCWHRHKQSNVKTFLLFAPQFYHQIKSTRIFHHKHKHLPSNTLTETKVKWSDCYCNGSRRRSLCEQPMFITSITCNVQTKSHTNSSKKWKYKRTFTI